MFDGALDNLFVADGNDKALKRLHERGELVPATIYAIRVVSKSDSADEWTHGLDMVTSGGPMRVAVRQQLIPDPWRAPLGERVLAKASRRAGCDRLARDARRGPRRSTTPASPTRQASSRSRR